MTPWIRKFAAAWGAIALLSVLPAPTHADSGTVRITVGKAGFIVGVGGGSGVLHFKGKNYRLSVGGISAGTIGVARAELVGTARNLRTAEDIVGTYTAASASVAVAGGGKVATLKNSKGVVLELRGKQAGFELSFDLSGVAISLE